MSNSHKPKSNPKPNPPKRWDEYPGDEWMDHPPLTFDITPPKPDPDPDPDLIKPLPGKSVIDPILD